MVALEDLEIIEQTIVNYELIWDEWCVEVDDGSWNREAVEKNIQALKDLVERLAGER